MEVFDVVISSVTDDFKLDVDITKVNKRELLVLENPGYKQVIEANPHLKGVRMDDDDMKKCYLFTSYWEPMTLPKYARELRLRVGRRGDPVADPTIWMDDYVAWGI